MFQSPRSGQICSNFEAVKALDTQLASLFQSPRSGQICSNEGARENFLNTLEEVSIP